MKSSRDGRSWTWVTSSRKGFLGVRRTCTCNGGFLCENSKCGFYSAYGKRNVYHFQKKEKMICKVCDEEATKVDCHCKKIWELDDDKLTVTVYHYGEHKCTAKKPSQLDEDKLREKFNNKNITPSQAANEIITDALNNP